MQVICEGKPYFANILSKTPMQWNFYDAGFVSYQQLLAVMAPTSSLAASFLGGVAAQRPHRVMMKGPGSDREPMLLALEICYDDNPCMIDLDSLHVMPQSPQRAAPCLPS